ncbi:hypothetical protein [Deinococcus sonorensis]|uniref:Uncharacterized protein n=1 Tax=Deinococcus sonorensis TaxID=309891 RepID=A0ABV8XZT5_9DEIO
MIAAIAGGLLLIAACGLAVQRFNRVAISPLPVAPLTACQPQQLARGQARWDAPGQGGFLYGNGTLLLQACRKGHWTLQVNGTAMQGIPPHLIITSGIQPLLERDVSGVLTLTVPAKAGQPLALTAPNTLVVLEARNLYVDHFHFQPQRPCLQGPVELSSPDVGTLGPTKIQLLSNGAVSLIACGAGEATFQLSGSETAGVGPLATVQVGGHTIFRGLIATQRSRTLRLPLRQGEQLQISFSNDAARQLDQRQIEVNQAVFQAD